MLIGPARNYLAQYLFRGEDVYKPVHMLSGGERGRLALALLALEDANFLLLDEPTNHLDIPAQEALQEVLDNFQGTILLVSHDRYLIDHLATQIWELDEGRLSVFPGPYAEFVAARTRATETAKQVAAQQRAEARRDQGIDRQSKNEARKRAKAVADTEAEVHRLEQQLARLEADLAAASQAQDVAKIHRLGTEYTATQQALEQAMESWAELAET
jgi:ATP-binding cassette subfamily F protein 3